MILPEVKCKEVIDGIEKFAEDNCNQSYNESVLFIGVTGSGKSTLMNYISEDPNLKSELNGDEKVYVGGKFSISPRFESCTLQPQKWENNEVTYWDLPGLRDNRGPEQEILNSFAINAISSISSKSKIVLVIERDLKRSNVGTWEEFFEQLERSGLIDKDFEDSISIIVTKGNKRTSIENIKKKLDEMKPRSPKLIEVLLRRCSEEFMCIFYEPKIGKKIDFKDKEKILRVIRNTRPIEKKFLPKVSEKCNSVLNQVTNYISEQYKDYLQIKFNEYDNKHQNSDSLERLDSAINSKEDMLNNEDLCPDKSKIMNFDQFFNFFKELSYETLPDDLQINFEWFKGVIGNLKCKRKNAEIANDEKKKEEILAESRKTSQKSIKRQTKRNNWLFGLGVLGAVGGACVAIAGAYYSHTLVFFGSVGVAVVSLIGIIYS